MAERETPFVLAFVLLLKLLNYPVPDGFMDLFSLSQHISRTLSLASYSIDMLMDRNPKTFKLGADKHNTYDFVIVGGGTAGSLLAMRLLDTKNRYKVLLLEAGAEPTFQTHSPFFNMFLWKNNATDWGYHSIPQRESCISCRKKKVKYLRGKGLGGTMLLGNSIVSRGHTLDYDQWVNATGDDSWGYAKLVKFFKKTENYRGSHDSSVNHGFTTAGTMKLTSQGVQPLVKEWLEGAKELGMKVGDVNEVQSKDMFSNVEVFVSDGKRQNTYDAILKKELWRRNLKITRYATVQKVVIDSKKYAKGVIYRRNHQDIEIRANKEVILCAGVINTPKIMMLSGLGPSQHLRDMSIKVKRDLPHVGSNFQDQPATMVGPLTIVNNKGFLPRRNLTYSSILEYYVNQSGILSSNMMSGIGYYVSNSSNNPDWPNIQLLITPMGIDEDTHKIINTAFDFKHGYMEKYLRDHKDNDAVWAFVSLARPISRGRIRLRDKEVNTPPNIDPNWFNDKADMTAIVEGMIFALKLFGTGPWQNIDAKLISTQFPGCERFKIKTPPYFECVANHLTFSMGNSGGTCRMGKSKDDSVVDSKLLVHKVKRLRIVDASVMPVVPNGMTGTAVLMLAEKAADMILEKWTNEVARHRDKSDTGSDE